MHASEIDTLAAALAARLSSSTPRVALPTQTTLEEFLAYQRPRKTAKSAKTDEGYLRRFFAAVEVEDLAELTPAAVALYLTRRSEEGAAPATLNRIREVVHTLFEWLRHQERIERNPVTRVRRVPVAAPRITYLELEQIPELLAAVAGDRIHALVATLVYAGLRRGEAVWLRREDVDLERRFLLVRAKASGEWQPKTRRNRMVPIATRLEPVLRAELAAGGAPWAFPSIRGCRWDPDNLTQRFRRLVRAAGLGWTLLDLRHTFGTQLAMKGVSLAKIAALMGNSPEICRRHYAHIATEDLHQDVEF